MYEIFFHLLPLGIGLFGIAGGGGSSSGGGGGGGGGGGSYNSSSGGSGSSDLGLFEIIFIITGLIIFFGMAFYGQRHALRVRSEKMKKRLLAAQAADSIWNQEALIKYADSIFLRHQKDWSAFDTKSLQEYMTPEYMRHTVLMLAALKNSNRQNQVDNIKIISTEILDFSDFTDNARDSFSAVIVARVDDIINDTALNKKIHKQTITATQTYKFIRSADTWLFSGIDQSTASAGEYNASLEKFAASHQMCYSIDWGWLLLPQRGQVFGTGQFGVSDINNHVIGMYKDVLIQLYSYKPNPAIARGYLIAQTSVPKNYGDIVVRRRNGVMNFKIRGLNKLSTEWGDFNKKYDVFASDTEQATSFELLNPSFMEKLEALPFEVSIEVVDNVVYLYAKEGLSDIAGSEVGPVRYETMLGVLKAAFKEMRM